jgi:hypothetical protein
MCHNGCKIQECFDRKNMTRAHHSVASLVSHDRTERSRSNTGFPRRCFAVIRNTLSLGDFPSGFDVKSDYPKNLWLRNFQTEMIDDEDCDDDQHWSLFIDGLLHPFFKASKNLILYWDILDCFSTLPYFALIVLSSFFQNMWSVLLWCVFADAIHNISWSLASTSDSHFLCQSLGHSLLIAASFAALPHITSTFLSLLLHPLIPFHISFSSG